MTRRTNNRSNSSSPTTISLLSHQQNGKYTPYSSSRRPVSTCPALRASINGVVPQESVESGSAPHRTTRVRTTPSLPCRAESHNATNGHLTKQPERTANTCFAIKRLLHELVNCETNDRNSHQDFTNHTISSTDKQCYHWQQQKKTGYFGLSVVQVAVVVSQ